MQSGRGFLLQLCRMIVDLINSFSWADSSALCFLLFLCIALYRK